MSWGMIGGAAIGLVGSTLAGNSAKKGAQASANAQLEAAQIAAEESRFRPIGVTNAFGSSNFTYDPSTGRVSGASYNVDPKIAAIRDQLLGLAGSGVDNLGAMNQAFTQGQQGLMGSVANAGDIIGQTRGLFNQRRDLMAPQRERDLANLRNANFQTGRSGLAVGGTFAGDYAAANPEMQAFFNAQRQQDDALLAQSEQDARRYRADDLSTLGGLFSGQSGALQPILQYLQGSQGAEEMGRSAFDIGSSLGGRIANPSGGSMLQAGLNAAAQSNLQASNIRNNLYQNAFNTAGNLFTNWMNRPQQSPQPTPYLNVGNGYTDPNSLYNIGGGGP